MFVNFFDSTVVLIPILQISSTKQQIKALLYTCFIISKKG